MIARRLNIFAIEISSFVIRACSFPSAECESKRLWKYLVQFPGCVLTTVDFQSPGKERPLAA